MFVIRPTELLIDLRNWYILIANIMGVYWLFAGLPDWQLVAGFMYVIDSHWLSRLLYLVFCWPVLFCLGGIVIFLPLAVVLRLFQIK